MTCPIPTCYNGCSQNQGDSKKGDGEKKWKQEE